MSSGSEANHAPEGREEDRVAAILVALREDLGPRGAVECRGYRAPGQNTPSEGMALTSKFSLTRSENLVVLGSLVGANKK
ncbi:hypothetical protein NEMBOFW57_006924 [Staphylotrichum longicolle]|uniref:Uncharacterized protein n=1 Tax=Staphylotrichum longicolle TaxID=669026 RepID=A0AAD4ETP5_9PEZI|nr:hypothetical protein NEMBOFW57_006924 [Staphylotrichum longicolle]